MHELHALQELQRELFPDKMFNSPANEQPLHPLLQQPFERELPQPLQQLHISEFFLGKCILSKRFSPFAYDTLYAQLQNCANGIMTK